MKWRHSFIYLIVLIFLGSYYYYFEVARKERLEEARKEAKRLFDVSREDIQALELTGKSRDDLRLERDGQWKIVKPVATEADEASLSGFLGILASLSMDRSVEESPESLEPFGLEPPVLRIRFQQGDRWHEILLGDENPLKDGRYGRMDNDTSVFLVARSDWNILDKGLDDFRRRDLFAFDRREVRKIALEWDDNATVEVEREEVDGPWTAPGHPAMKLGGSKVDNVVDQLGWLRAEDFLENEATGLDRYGLDEPKLLATLALEGGETATLKLGRKIEGTEPEQLAAVSSQLEAVVAVPADVLHDLPASLEDLEDRSLLSYAVDNVTRIRWRLGDEKGDVVLREEEDRWKWRDEDGTALDMEEPWKARSLAWDLGEAEYDRKVASPVPPSGDPWAEVDFWKDDRRLGALMWSRPSESEGDFVPVWVETADNETLAVEMKKKSLSDLESKFREIEPPEKD